MAGESWASRGGVSDDSDLEALCEYLTDLARWTSVLVVDGSPQNYFAAPALAAAAVLLAEAGGRRAQAAGFSLRPRRCGRRCG